MTDNIGGTTSTFGSTDPEVISDDLENNVDDSNPETNQQDFNEIIERLRATFEQLQRNQIEVREVRAEEGSVLTAASAQVTPA